MIFCVFFCSSKANKQKQTKKEPIIRKEPKQDLRADEEGGKNHFMQSAV